MKSHLKFPNAGPQTNVTKRKTSSTKHRACLAALGRSTWPLKFFQLCVFALAAFLEAALARCSPVGMQSFLARARNQLARPVEFLSIPNMCMGANSAKAFSPPSFTTRVVLCGTSLNMPKSNVCWWRCFCSPLHDDFVVEVGGPFCVGKQP